MRQPIAHNLELELRSGLPEFVVTDPDRLTQVLSNVIGNAIKFTPEGKVRVCAHSLTSNEVSSQIEFVVRDTGIGFPDEEIERLLMPFERSDAGINRQFDGIGLGLAISKRLMETIGGRLEVTRGIETGSEVRCMATFFIADHADSNDPASNDDAQPAQSVYLLAKARAEAQSSPLTVLVVDDSRINTTFVSTLLGLYGVNVVTCDAGSSAILACERESFDLIFMDVHMPGMDGIEATGRIRTMLPDACPPVIALTADAGAESRHNLLRSGFDEVIDKPASENDLVSALNRWTPHQLTVTQKQSTVQSQSTPEKWMMIDRERGIELAGGDQLLWETNVLLLANDVTERMELIDPSNNVFDFDVLGQHAHRIAGSASYIGARFLERDARALQEAISNVDNANFSVLHSCFYTSANDFLGYAADLRSRVETNSGHGA